MTWTPLRFRFTGDVAEGPDELRVTYVGRITRKEAEADARRRFEEWCRRSDFSRRRACDQVVVR